MTKSQTNKPDEGKSAYESNFGQAESSYGDRSDKVIRYLHKKISGALNRKFQYRYKVR